MTSVNAQVVFITGGGQGIGAEVARRLRAKGAKLVLTDELLVAKNTKH